MSEFPKTIEFYVHSDKESNYDQAEQIGLNEEAQKTFRYTGYEVEFTLEVQEDGTSLATHVNGIELKSPVKI